MAARFALICVALVAIATPTAAAPVDPGRDVIDFLGELVMAVDGWSVYDCVNTMTTDAPNSYRLMGTPTHDAFVKKYGNIFTDRLALPSVVQHFENGSAVNAANPVTGGDNILGVLAGRNASKWVVIGGHYDTREATFGGGAYDNTSGICVVLEIAAALKQVGVPLEASVVFAWWDGEEWGLHGSKAFLADPAPVKQLLGLAPEAPIEILSAVSFDMVGLNYPAYNTWAQYGDPAETLETAVLNLRTAPTQEENFTLCANYGCYRYDEYTEGQLQAFADYQDIVRWVAYDYLRFPSEHVWVYDDEYGRSDHVPFIEAGIPGMRVQGSHDEEYPHYHRPTDTLPALTALAGSDTHLRAGFDKAADIGALANLLVAYWGSTTAPLPETVPEAPPAPPSATPAIEMGTLLAVSLFWALRRRDQGAR